MASILCRNKGFTHSHSSVTESKICYGIISYPAAPVAPVVEPATQRQLDYIKDLRGDLTRARAMSKREASDYISGLKSGRIKPVSLPIEEQPAPEIAATSKSDFVKAMIDMVPDGYFAVREQDGAPITFMRVTRPKAGNFRGGIKVSTQHGPNLEVRWVLWPSGKVSIYRWSGHDIEDDLLLLMADWKSATRLYAEKAKKCGRCNTKLTDPRSRFYLIGPDCEKVWQWWIDDVAGERGGYWEQQPLHVQEKYLPEYKDL